MFDALAYIPMDRRHALAHGQQLADRTTGAALFADISGFTPLTEALVRELGPQRGAEELTRYLNLVYDAVIDELHRFGGSVIAFAGDAITCWLADDDGRRATACALAMQAAMAPFVAIVTPAGSTVSLGMKAAVAAGAARRFLIGDPTLRVIDALAGLTLVQLANAEHLAHRGETVVDGATLDRIADLLETSEIRHHATDDQRIGVVTGMRVPVADAPWPVLTADALSEDQLRVWLLPQVYERLRHGSGNFLAELRPTVACFLRFAGIDYDNDDVAGDKLDTYIRWVQEIVARYEGTLIDLNIGDKGSYLYINFGAPVAHEDNADRAASAALALCEGPQLDYILPVQIGISQGRMRAGAYGAANHRTYGVLGDEVNMAARLMMAAQPGQIILSEAAQRSLGRSFVVEKLPSIRVKGKSEPAVIFALTGIQQVRSSQLTAPFYALPMIGRQSELAAVTTKMAQAAEGHGQLVGLVGEPGIGKSRLLAEVIRLGAQHGFARYGGECESYGTNSSYLVWQPIWRGIFGIDSSWSLREQTSTLAGRLRSINSALRARLPLLGALLNIEIADNALTNSFDAKLRKTSLEALLVDCLQASARQTPLLIVLEDCHWLDPLSQDLLETIGNAVAAHPVLLILTYRPLDQAGLRSIRVSHLPHYTEIELVPLTVDESTQFVSSKLAQLSGAVAPLAQTLAERLTTEADGNPFYIEELINYLHSRAIDFSDNAALEKVELPDSLQRLVLTLVDQLSESQKITVKVASVIGRVFRAAWLTGIYAELGDWRLVHTDLQTLSRLDLMLLERSEPEFVYFFRQVITQGVTYESLPHAMKSVLHEKIGQFIEKRYPDALDQYLDLLAYHYDRSANRSKQCEYLLKAGAAAQAAYANTAAIDYYQRVLPLLPDAEQAPIMLKLGQVLELVGQWQDADNLYRQALALTERPTDLPLHAQAQRSLGWLLRKQGEYADALAWMERTGFSFEQLNDPAGISQLLADVGEVYRLQGNYAKARIYYDESLAVVATIATPGEQMTARAYALKGAGTVATWQGDYAAARALNEESLAIRRQLGDKPGIAVLLNNLGIVALFQRDLESARRLYGESLVVFREIGDKYSLGQLLNNQALVANDQGDHAEARALLHESLEIRRQLGDKAGLALSLNTLADVVLDEGDYGAARPLLTESLTLSRELGDQTAIAYLLEDYGGLAAFEAQPERALRLAGFAAALREAIGAPLPPAEQARVDRMLEPARQTLSTEVAAIYWGQGQAMTQEEAIEYTLQDA